MAGGSSALALYDSTGAARAGMAVQPSGTPNLGLLDEGQRVLFMAP